jgi:hypothetical protein
MVKPRAAPATKPPGRCKAIAAKTCPFKRGQSPALANIDVQTGSLCRASDTKEVHLRVIKGYFDDSRSDGEAWTVAGYLAPSDI